MADDELKWLSDEDADDELRQGDAQHQPSDGEDSPEELPASVIFMEMMRRAAAKQSSREAPKDARASKPPIVRHQRPSSRPLPPLTEPAPQPKPSVPLEPAPASPAIPPSPATSILLADTHETQAPSEADAHDADASSSELGAVAQAVVADEALAPVAPSPAPPRQPTKRPLTDDERRQQAQMEAQRVQRVKRRQQKRRARQVGILGGMFRSFFVAIISAGLMATILSWWTDSDFLRPEMRRSLQVALATGGAPTNIPTAIPTPNWMRTIGIVSGHRGPGQQASYDPGAVCPDGLTENEINYNVATRVVDELRRQGYRAELLEEFDARLDNYQAEALVSIHANTCAEFAGGASGFIVAKAAARAENGEDTRLAECIAAYYEPLSGLARRFETTVDMTDYHTFREIHPLTPAAIIELGFMRDDRAVITEKPDVLASAIAQGVLCFINREVVRPNAQTQTPVPPGDADDALLTPTPPPG